MLNDFVARFAYDITGPGGLLLDLTSVRDLQEQIDTISKTLERLEEHSRLEGRPLAIFAPNSFMKRRAGQGLCLNGLPSWDLTHVIDLSGCYIPGHGTPTLLLVARAQPPSRPDVFVVRCVRGEPREPEDPSRGVVWSSVVACVERPTASDEWARCAYVKREALRGHPWAFEELVP